MKKRLLLMLMVLSMLCATGDGSVPLAWLLCCIGAAATLLLCRRRA